MFWSVGSFGVSIEIYEQSMMAWISGNPRKRDGFEAIICSFKGQNTSFPQDSSHGR